ncbi:MAG: hypothetical protein LBE59_06660 [Nevskiaceae bacterium]|jgi:hypothetical protein|nr:hypothetical protein [Nevskiaceae bacterium]
MGKKKALVIYYSQMGQTRDAITAFLRGFSRHAHCDLVQIEPQEQFAFPWKMNAFFRAFPRCIKARPPSIKPLAIDWSQYDLIILGYQVWFLSPSLPIQGFLDSQCAKELKDKPVVTLATCRNLWISAFNTIRNSLTGLGANFVGQITLCERNPVWASFVTTPFWIFTGRKQGFWFFPPAGIAPEQFATLEPKGEQLGQLLANGAALQCTATAELLGSNLGTVSLAMMEWVGIRVFHFWAGLILRLAPTPGFTQDLLLVFFRLSLVITILTVAPCTRIFEILVHNDPKWTAQFSRPLPHP